MTQETSHDGRNEHSIIRGCQRGPRRRRQTFQDQSDQQEPRRQKRLLHNQGLSIKAMKAEVNGYNQGLFTKTTTAEIVQSGIVTNAMKTEDKHLQASARK